MKAKALVVAAMIVAGLGASGPARAVTCGTPAAEWNRATPAEVGLDADKVQTALDWATQHSSYTVAVIRHGCLTGESRLDPVTSAVPIDGWSMTKSVTAMVVGRAVTLGLIDIDAPIGPLFPEADAAHAAITLRDLLTQSSGLHLNWVRDLNPAMPDRVRDVLALPFDHPRGSYWTYHQGTINVVAEAVSRAVGQDFQAFAGAELFSKIGINGNAWTWDRDRAGNTEGWAHLHMDSGDWARLGELMLHRGNWNGTQLISEAYIDRAISPAPTNHAYGFLFWLNGGDSYVLPPVEGRDEGLGEIIPSAPSDLYVMAGKDEQRTYVIPSLDMVVVRLGTIGSREGDTRVSIWTGRGGEFDYELMRLLMDAVTDADVPHATPYAGSDLRLPPADDGIVGDAWATDDVLAGAGLGPNAPAGCNPVGCD